jgi:2-methylfumaryl-CoA hydratase
MSETTMSKSRPGNYFEDFSLGMRTRHATPRTLELADQSLYIALTGSRFAASSASTVARELGLRDRPLEDLLVFHIAFGKTVPEISHNGIANLGYAELRFLEPVYAGDTIEVQSEVIGLRENSNGRSGIVYVRSTASNQHGRSVLTWVRWVMVHKSKQESQAREALVPQLQASVPAASIDCSGWSTEVARISRATGVSQFWEAYEAGERIDHQGGMTINESDHSIATRLYQNTAKAHFDATLMASQPLQRRLVYGGHVISICKSLSYEGLENTLCWAAINAGQHVAPTFAGDTLRCATQVVERMDLGQPHLGALRLRTVAVKNLATVESIEFSAGGTGHPAGVVLDIDYTVLMPRRPR